MNNCCAKRPSEDRYQKRGNNEWKKQIVEMLERKKVSICCVQETQYKGEGCKVFREGEEGYKFLWKGENDKRGGVGILIREELEKEIVEVKRITTIIMKIKLVMEGNLMHVISAYASQVGKMKEEKEEERRSFGG